MRIKRVAAENAFERKPAAPQRTKTLNRLDGILRAGREKSAVTVPFQAGQVFLIKPDHAYHNLFHLRHSLRKMLFVAFRSHIDLKPLQKCDKRLFDLKKSEPLRAFPRDHNEIPV